MGSLRSAAEFKTRAGPRVSGAQGRGRAPGLLHRLLQTAHRKKKYFTLRAYQCGAHLEGIERCPGNVSTSVLVYRFRPSEPAADLSRRSVEVVRGLWTVAQSSRSFSVARWPRVGRCPKDTATSTNAP